MLHALILELIGNLGDNVRHESLTLGSLGRDKTYKLVVSVVIEVAQAQILELPLDLEHAELLSKRSIDIECLPCLLDLLRGRLILHRTHIVKTVGKFDEYNSRVTRHGKEHLTRVLSLHLFLTVGREDIKLCNTFDEQCDRRSEQLI